jgi:hypothetical protein
MGSGRSVGVSKAAARPRVSGVKGLGASDGGTASTPQSNGPVICQPTPSDSPLRRGRGAGPPVRPSFGASWRLLVAICRSCRGDPRVEGGIATRNTTVHKKASPPCGGDACCGSKLLLNAFALGHRFSGGRANSRPSWCPPRLKPWGTRRCGTAGHSRITTRRPACWPRGSPPACGPGPGAAACGWPWPPPAGRARG